MWLWSLTYNVSFLTPLQQKSQGLKYVKLSFSNNQLNNSKGDRTSGKSTGPPGNHMNSKGYMRHSGMAYFPGGIDSCNTEASLISSGRKFY